MTSIRPCSAAAPRPGNRPFYVDARCSSCRTALALADRLANPTVSSSEIWHDRWQCPKCRSGVYLDWPSSEFEALVQDVKRMSPDDLDRVWRTRERSQRYSGC